MVTLNDIAHVEYLGHTQLAKVITCRRCGEVVYKVSEDPSQSEIDIELTGLRAHFELRHAIVVHGIACSDPNCIHEHAPQEI